MFIKGDVTLGNEPKSKRDLLRDRLIAAAESEIAALGLAGLKARSVTKAAGCALGGLYTVVPDLDGLIMLVNSQTIARLEKELGRAAEKAATPEDTLQELAVAYADFALSETNLWYAAFHHRLPDGQALPDWHQAEFTALVAYLATPLAQILPALSRDALALRAQTLFGAVHGVVQLSLNGQFIGSPRDALADEVRALARALSRGLA